MLVPGATYVTQPRGAKRGSEVKKIGLYVHVPFCVRKCHYCDFVSFPYSPDMVRAYLKGLQREFELYHQLLAEFKINTIYYGGGTPSCLSPGELSKLFTLCHRHPLVKNPTEISIECNPGTISREKLQVMRAAGVNRISLGVQALQDEHLTRLGRTHRSAEIYESYALIRRVGFQNVNFDLMFALPDQTWAEWATTLTGVIDLGPEHISTYNLVFEKGTQYYRWREAGVLPRPDEELDLAMYQLALDMLPRAGYRQYEISSFAPRGLECRHNLTYWHNEPYLGLGPGAHSYDGKVRRANTKSWTRYLTALGRGRTPVVRQEELSIELQQAETIILGLRMRDGIDRQRFKERFRRDLCSLYADSIDRLEQRGLLQVTPLRVGLTMKGLLFANQVSMEFLPT